MNLLLDTHAFLWAIDNDPKLSPNARDAIVDGNNLVFVSAATAWEISIKKAIGKLKVPEMIFRRDSTRRVGNLLPTRSSQLGRRISVRRLCRITIQALLLSSKKQPSRTGIEIFQCRLATAVNDGEDARVRPTPKGKAPYGQLVGAAR